MKVTTEYTEDSQVILNVEVEPERFDKSRDQAFRRIAGRVNIPGFRKGKAPRPVVERYVGSEAIMEEALKNLIPETYSEALSETRVEPIAQPEFELVQTEPLVYKATVAVEPTVELGDYCGVRMKEEEVKVEAEDVDRLLEALRQDHAEWIEPEEARAVKEGDRAIVNLRGEIEGKPMMGAEPHEDLEIIAGEGAFLPGFDQVLIGMSVGETKPFQLALPQATGDEVTEEPLVEPATPEASGEVTLRGIKEQHLPELNDEFARAMGEFADVAELRRSLHEGLEQRLRAEARARLEDAVVRAAVERAKVSPPPAMVNHEMERSLDSVQRRLQSQGLKLMQFLRHVGQTEEDYLESLRPQALERVRTALVLREVARAEGLTVSAEEVEAEVERLRSMLKKEDADLRNRLGEESARRSLAADLLQRKTVDRLVQCALTEDAEKAEAVAASAAGEAAAEETATVERTSDE